MKTRSLVLFGAVALLLAQPAFCRADSRGDDLARWIDARGREVWGPPPPRCDDLTFARRVYLDLVGRVPGVAEVRDFQAMGEDRRRQLVEQLLFTEGERERPYERLRVQTLATYWQRVLLPPSATVEGSANTLRGFLADCFADRQPFDETIAQLANIPSATSAGRYYQLLGSLPENYAGAISRVALGVRIECAQCHDHPFTDWSQRDFWGLAAFYSDLPRRGDDPNASVAASNPGAIEFEGEVYRAKLLWANQPISRGTGALRSRFAQWLTAKDNPYFASTAVNRFWEYLVGRGLYSDVENLDQAFPEQRAFLDELGQRFAESGFRVEPLMAAICKSRWYQAVSTEGEARTESFSRPLKALSPQQVFDSLEQALLLPVSRVDPRSPRWSGGRTQMIQRLSETVGTSPEDYSAGIPQALMMMNGRLTDDAIDPDRSRLLRAVADAPFFDQAGRIETLYLAVLTRAPSAREKQALSAYLDRQESEVMRQRAFGEVLWALLNSPEFVLCR